MRVEEAVLPGVGRKYTISVRSGDRIVVVVHHSGGRELQYYEKGELEEPVATLDLTDEEARELGAILAGVLFAPEAVGDTRTKLAAESLEWVRIEPGSPAVRQQIGDFATSGVHTLAVLRGGEALLPNPAPETVLQAGDTLVVAGSREAVERFVQKVRA
ncbi:MAG TPA: TrkA C-terminal domain-containing protein [Meiothermus sp.]|jgi:TrkA domain protein|nr:TrkA C-terminal domain-containing protein [Meiothermus sp.]